MVCMLYKNLLVNEMDALNIPLTCMLRFNGNKHGSRIANPNALENVVEAINSIPIAFSTTK